MNYYGPFGRLFGLVAVLVVGAWVVTLALGADVARDLAYAAAGLAVVSFLLRFASGRGGR